MTKHEAEAAERERCATRGRIAQLENKVVDIEIRSLPPTAEDGVVVSKVAFDGLIGMARKTLGLPVNRDKTPAQLVEMARAVIAISAAQAGNDQRAGAKQEDTLQSLCGIGEPRPTEQERTQPSGTAPAKQTSSAAHQQAAPTGAQQEAVGQVELVRLDATQTWNADSKLVAFFGGEAAKRVAECSADGVWTVHDEAEFKRLNPAFHALWKQNERQAAEIERLGGGAGGGSSRNCWQRMAFIFSDKGSARKKLSRTI